MFCLISATVNLLFYESSVYIPVGTMGGIEATSLIVLTTLLTLIIQRSLQCLTLGAVAMSVVGTIFLTQPHFLFKYFEDTHVISTTPVCFHPIKVETSLFNETEKVENISTNATKEYFTTAQQTVISDYVKGYLLIVGSSVGYVLEMAVQKQRLHDINIYVLLFWMCLTGVVLSAAVMFAIETLTFPKSTTCIVLLVAHSAASSAASLFSVSAVPLISPVTYSLLSSLQLVLYLVAQSTVLKMVNPGHGNWEEVVGAVLVLFASVAEPVSKIYKHWRDNRQ